MARKRAREVEDEQEVHDLNREAQKLSPTKLDQKHPNSSTRTKRQAAVADDTPSDSAPEYSDSKNKKVNPPYHQRQEYGIHRVNINLMEFLNVRPDGLYTTKVWNNAITVNKCLMLTNEEVRRLQVFRAFHGVEWSIPVKKADWNDVTDAACQRFEDRNTAKITKGLQGRPAKQYKELSESPKPSSKRRKR